MKLKKLNINSYKHLHNLKFDFTYPDAHTKAGEPLDKICIIGQSATGKTSVLELIKDNITQLILAETINNRVLRKAFQLNFDGDIEYKIDSNSIKMNIDSITVNENVYKRANNSASGSGAVNKLILGGLKSLYFSSDTISPQSISIFNQNPQSISIQVQTKNQTEFLNTAQEPNYIYEFVHNINQELWFLLLSKILDYRKRFTQMASEVINKGAIADINKLTREFNKWSETNKNPLEKFAEKFNPILKKLNLEIDLINTEYPIPIKTKRNENIIPISDLSTGTKGLLLSMFPLFELDTTDAIILIDEPERSLFPDMQIDLINHYQRLAPDAQLIVASHSPFIAAAFEPEERFVLYFKENGEVDFRRGESPIGDDPNDILRNDFNIDYYNDFGKQAYQKYLELKIQIPEEKDKQKKKELVVEMAKLGDKYNF